MINSNEKMLKQKIVGRTVYLLRRRLHLTQLKLAEEIGWNIDAGSISRWERGACLPQSAARKRLVDIAQRAGQQSLADVFAEPISNWRNLVESIVFQDQLISLDIVSVNLTALAMVVSY